jgi:succinate dehydrogenase/fumarate reductase flavoprotein subunit
MYEIVSTDVLVIGGGAASRAAIEAGKYAQTSLVNEK